ncbi:MAG TPA: EAL domain-containing protein [Kineosporiaceae bacterium]|nr:EAL domain-containing protein [Kineosporiaceae bacterium]
MTRRYRSASFACGSIGAFLTVVYTFRLDSGLDDLIVLVVAVGSCAALAAGPRLHRPPDPWPWRLLAGAAILSVCGLIGRPWAVGQHGAAVYSAEAFTLSGYALLITSLALMLRPRGLGRHALTDGFIISLGAAVAATLLFAVPGAQVRTWPMLLSVLAGLYPFVDVVLLLLLLNLAFSSAADVVSFRLITVGMIGLFLGDGGYAWLGTLGQLHGSALLDLPYLVTYTAFGAAALHPSMVELSSVTPRTVQSWSVPRLALIVPALLSPTLLALLQDPPPADRVVVVVATVGLVAALLNRATSAVHGYARAQQVLLDQATHDALTGLPNRAGLADHVQALLRDREGGPAVSLLYVDLDEFKLVNDHWGHETGDRLLVEIAGRLTGIAGPHCFTARIGGDEFAVVGRLGEGPACLAETLREALALPVQLSGLDLVVTASVGIATAGDQRTAEALLRDADTALYRAKADGRNRCTAFQAGMRQTVRARVETELQLRQALGQDQLWVAYQPVIDPRSERTVGAEALVRWNHPDRGPIPPGEFIPVAEETGLITQVGSWVLEKSLEQLAGWRRDDLLPDPFTLSVNMSAHQVHDPHLLPWLRSALDRHRIPVDRLVLEITESVMMADTETAADVLSGMRALGLRLSVDDFGTGYSSLSYLSRFPVDEVKIDRSFVHRLGEAGGGEAIVRAVVAMAEALGLEVVAEGVETPAQCEALCHLGVHRAQGWLWGAAVDGEEFARRHLAAPVTRAAGNP